MKRDELIKLLTEKFDADEEIVFLVNDTEYGETKETNAEVRDFEETYYKGHWELAYNGKTYSSFTKLGIYEQAYQDFVPKSFVTDNMKYVRDTDDIHTVTKVLAIG